MRAALIEAHAVVLGSTTRHRFVDSKAGGRRAPVDMPVYLEAVFNPARTNSQKPRTKVRGFGFLAFCAVSLENGRYLWSDRS